MTVEEKRLREYRRRNFITTINKNSIEPERLAKQLGGVDKSYISQLKIGHRDITFEVARQLEKATGAPHMSLDSPPGSGIDVSGITDNELRDKIVSVLTEICSRAKRPAKGAQFDSMLAYCMIDTRARGFYNEGYIRYIATEAFKQ